MKKSTKREPKSERLWQCSPCAFLAKTRNCQRQSELRNNSSTCVFVLVLSVVQNTWHRRSWAHLEYHLEGLSRMMVGLTSVRRHVALHVFQCVGYYLQFL
jgi:hypothetical protein